MSRRIDIEALIETDHTGKPDGLYVERLYDRQRGLKRSIDLMAGLDAVARAQLLLNLSDAFADEIEEAIELGDGRL